VHYSQPNLRCKKKALSGFEGLLEIVGLEVMVKVIRAGTYLESWMERIPDCRSCDDKMWAPNEVRTNGIESTLVFDNLKERVE